MIVSHFKLHEVAAPLGWTAALLPIDLPVADATLLERYGEAVEALLNRIEAFRPAAPEEVLLLFSRLRPGLEIEVFRNNARVWLPEFGMGVWLHQDPPTTWTTDEFERAPPGTLRAAIERVVRVQPHPAAQLSAWRSLLGSGAALRTAGERTFLKEATAALVPTLADPSLTSFPFYVPLLSAETLTGFSAEYDQPLEMHLPGVDAYLRESVEDGGLFLLVRQPPGTFWKSVLRAPLDMEVLRLSSSAGTL